MISFVFVHNILHNSKLHMLRESCLCFTILCMWCDISRRLTHHIPYLKLSCPWQTCPEGHGGAKLLCGDGAV